MPRVPESPATPIPANVTSAPSAAPAAAPKRGPVSVISGGAWSPLKIPLFRSLWIATVVSYIGTWAREAGGQELMGLLTAGKANQSDMVAQVVTMSNLPICFLSIFAGVLADVLDRRRFLVYTQLWMVGVSAVLAALTLAGAISPLTLLGLTLLLGVGTALSGPAFQAIVPELVPPGDMPLAVALNSVALNIARALGPMLFTITVALVVGPFGERWHSFGIGLSFAITAVSFLGVAWVLYRWDRPPQRAAVHGEQMWGAMRAGLQYTFHSRAMRAILLRVVLFIMCAVVVWAQFKIIAKYQLGVGTVGFGALMSFMGAGAIVGVILMPGLQQRYSIDKVVNASTALFALGLVAMAFVRHYLVADLLMFFLGINWVVVPTNFNVATQKSVPAWVKGRALSMYLTFLFGSFAAGSALWGRVTHLTSADPRRPDPSTSLLIAGTAMAAGLVLVRRYPLTINDGQDLSPAFKPGPGQTAGPDLPPPLDPSAAVSGPETGGNYAVDDADMDGPVDVTVEYEVDPARAKEFVALMHDIGEQRRRNGVTRWRLTPGGTPGGNGHTTAAGHRRYTESFRFGSVAEYTRQPSRMTRADLALHERAWSFHPSEEHPVVYHARAAVQPVRERAFEETGNAIDRLRSSSARRR